ncbi:hypothetical protein GCM10010121_067620 [Streptomyces brasiliensis]|uniref:Uncharacterized protein n=1 Tax=Streptomyces brasiliensis TaxID=1954 RepID=A0A917P0H7_9ACTN|nr:hypothetical protein GCM10010121_067620 [Streptomyces brasiliensis]
MATLCHYEGGTWRILPGDNGPRPDTLTLAARPAMAFATWAGVARGWADRWSAAAPAACGDAIDVPE